MTAEYVDGYLIPYWLSNEQEKKMIKEFPFDAPADAVQVGGSHYKDMPIPPWDLMEAVLTYEEFRGFLRGNVIKYSLRAGRKEGATDDAEKARHYMKKLEEIDEKMYKMRKSKKPK